MNVTTLLNNKRILLALAMIVVVTAAVIAATGAFFSDTETSTGNTFTAGAIDLKIDSEQHYNGNVCEGGVWVGSAPYPVEGTACTGTWDITDLTVEKFFNFNDLKPGDYGENTISIHVDTNDAWMCAAIVNTGEADNTKTEPESLDDPDGNAVGEPTGELDSVLNFFAWVDEGTTPGFDNGTTTDSGEGDNVYQSGETVLGTATAADLGDQTWALAEGGDAPIAAGSTGYIGLAWCMGEFDGNYNCDGSTVDNASQTDSWYTDIAFYVEQSRNNDQFRCEDWKPSTDNGGDDEVGAILSDYSAPSCNVTVGSGQSHTTIQGGVDSLNGDSGTVCVEDGTYDENVSTGGANQDIVALNPQGATIEGGVRLLFANNTIQGFEIQGTTDISGVGGTAYGVFVNADGALVANNQFVGSYTGQGSSAPGIVTNYGTEPTNLQIINNTITGFGKGIFLNPTHNALVKWNDIFGNDGAISSDYPDGNTITLNDIRNNTGSGVGVAANAGHTIAINVNNITGNGADNEASSWGTDPVNATNNWWGDVDGSDDTDGGTGPITYDPEATSEFAHR